MPPMQMQFLSPFVFRQKGSLGTSRSLVGSDMRLQFFTKSMSGPRGSARPASVATRQASPDLFSTPQASSRAVSAHALQRGIAVAPKEASFPQRVFPDRGESPADTFAGPRRSAGQPPARPPRPPLRGQLGSPFRQICLTQIRFLPEGDRYCFAGSRRGHLAGQPFPVS